MKWLLNLLAKVSLKPGDRVNLTPTIAVERCDGYVVARTCQGVLVEWPRHGIRWESPKALTLIVA